MPDPGHDALDAVRAHLDDAHAAADRLVREAQRQAEEAAAAVPPRGWESAAREPPRPSELASLLALLEAARDTLPREITHALAVALRDLLLALRALVDWYVQRLGEPAEAKPVTSEARQDAAPPPEVEDIPLD